MKASKAPLAVAGLISVPLYFAALMASSLALDKPHVVGNKEFPSTGATEAKVWLAALIAPAILLAAGALGLLLRQYGVYLVSVVGIAVCLVLPHLSSRWIAGHEERFPIGIDFIPDNDPSNLSSRGEWEKAAQSTVESITHWTLALAIGAIVVALVLELRRRRGSTPMTVPPPPPAVTGEGEVAPVTLPER
ncbi:MAG TPA: hypothetical protein VGF23_07955 [Gaiellaceae bacterium]